MSKTLIIGDAHLGRSQSIGKPAIGNALNSRVSDQFQLLDWIFEQAVENGADCIIFTGDVFEDVKPDFFLVNFFFQFLSKCELNNIEVHIVAGNHDIKRVGNYYNSVLDLVSSVDFPNIHFYKQINTIHREGVSFTLLPFRDRRSFDCESNVDALNLLGEQFPYELAEIPLENSKVLIGHLALEGSLPVGDEFDDYANELICPLSMFKEYDYVWMGHIHRPQVRSRKPYLAHIGSLDLSDFGETDHTKILVLFDTDNPKKFKEIPVPSRPLRKISLVVPSQADATSYVVEQINAFEKISSFKNAIVRIEIKLPNLEISGVERPVIEELMNNLGVHYVCNFSESRNLSVVALQKKEMDNTIQPKSAVKLYADLIPFESEEDKSEYIKLANEVIDECRSSVK